MINTLPWPSVPFALCRFQLNATFFSMRPQKHLPCCRVVEKYKISYLSIVPKTYILHPFIDNGQISILLKYFYERCGKQKQFINNHCLSLHVPSKTELY